jgi:hypothetical protein
MKMKIFYFLCPITEINENSNYKKRRANQKTMKLKKETIIEHKNENFLFFYTQ